MSSGEFYHTPKGQSSLAKSPPTFSSSSRMQERFSTTLSSRNQRRRSRSRPRRRNSPSAFDGEPSNSSILAGASIIKRQLSNDSPIRAAQHSEPPNSHRQSWDPWKAHSKTVRGRILDYGSDKEQPVATKKNSNRHRAQEILSEGDHYFHVKHRSNMSNSNEFAPITPNEITNCMVKRLSELDDSTFASSKSGGNGYLPNQLMTGLSCGGLNNTLGNFLPASSMQATNCNSANEELETSTLDYLANLHTHQDDLNHVDPKEGDVKPPNHQELSSSSFVTAAATPFEKLVSVRSSFHDELLKDPAYAHALKAGTLWQSLCSQHVRFPAHWWDGQEPVGPPMGSCKKRARPWSYLGRHRVQGDAKLIKLIGNRSSSGRILLHLVARDDMTGDPMEDICCGCYHPNARGVRTSANYDPKVEDCRDVWIAHRRRARDRGSDEDYLYDYSNNNNNDNNTNDDEITTLESLLRHQNKGRVHLSPLGAQGGKHSVNNQNLRIVFGSKPPVYTVFCMESELYELFQTKLDGSIPASVALLRHYLRFQMNK
eukprot:CAMPEP_0116136790 /NCGR_PEP_ID=MMETSP0329-20121206/11917_1 /TAXON_ID=697910 /ORGANISM="Pseudo-nitzschia arenysensis, Strain B593" /LENGTH=541 /DNA_ID=CAMNT_0003631691 /DNA_START=392 /DNA_END=2017 /DNA_ORIENTATION=-